MVSFTLLDLTLEMYRRMMNDNPITQIAAGVGVAGSKKLSMMRGRLVSQFALIAEGPSPYGENWGAAAGWPLPGQLRGAAVGVRSGSRWSSRKSSSMPASTAALQPLASSGQRSKWLGARNRSNASCPRSLEERLTSRWATPSPEEADMQPGAVRQA